MKREFTERNKEVKRSDVEARSISNSAKERGGTMKAAKSLSILMAIAFLTLVTQIFLPVPVLAGDDGFRGNNHDNKNDNKHDYNQDYQIQGRYVSAENAYDLSSVHAFAAPDASLVGPPIFFAAAAVMIVDGKGNVCGESDGFYSGISAPGVNLGPNLFHGTYTIEASGRITILTCSDGAPSDSNKFCKTFTPCATVTKAQVGYVQGHSGKKIVTVEQTGYKTDTDSTGFLVHKRVWTKADSENDENHH